jgi:hypothetical protein
VRVWPQSLQSAIENFKTFSKIQQGYQKKKTFMLETLSKNSFKKVVNLKALDSKSASSFSRVFANYEAKRI